jgi:hypothetical protein
MACNHDWVQYGPVRICDICEAVEYDGSEPVRISNDQAAALGFARNVLGLLQARFGTFPEDVFRRFA